MTDKIIHFLREQGRAMDVFDIADGLNAPIDGVSACLTEMVRAGQAIISKKGKYAAPETLGLIPAKAVIMRSGVPYARPLDGSPDMKISRSGELRAMHGDKVLVRLQRAHGPTEPGVCELAAVTERAQTKLIGILKPDVRYEERKPVIVRRGHHKKLVHQPPLEIPYLSAQPCDLHVACGIEVIGDTLGADIGDTVALRVVEWPMKHIPLKAEVVRVLGKGMDIGVQMEALIESHGLPTAFPQAALDEAAALREVGEEDIKDRFDARGIVAFTIDGEDAKDFDDAVSLEKTEQGWRLGVHIADVSHYVREGGEIDKEALRRGTSVYLPGRTLPMLPENLCNNLCSLMPERDRLTLSLFMELRDGGIVDHRLERAVIRSKARLTYTQVNRLLAGEENDVPEALHGVLRDMDAVARVLREKREARGSLDFDLAEPEFTLDEAGRPLDVQARVRGEAERMIEDFMLAANETVAAMARACQLPLLYRVHDRPDPDRLATLEVFMANLNHPVHLGREPHPRELQTLLKDTADLPEAAVVKHTLLRSLKRACYSDQPQGHFGLAARDYCHFTSPIRRYPDLTVHRMLKMLLSGGLDAAQAKAGRMEELASETSRCEYTAATAERDADDMMKAWIMKPHEGEEFDGVVSGVNSWGFFVELDNTVEGLVRTRTLDDYFDYNESGQCLVGERSRRVIRLGDRVHVLLDSVDTMACEINFTVLWPRRR